MHQDQNTQMLKTFFFKASSLCNRIKQNDIKKKNVLAQMLLLVLTDKHWNGKGITQEQLN